MSDWDTVTVLRKRAPKASAMKSETAVNQARRQGVAVDTSQKCKPISIVLKCLAFYFSYHNNFQLSKYSWSSHK